jgi:hypothetical protein
MNIPKALIVAAGFVLILKPPAFAQSSADPYDTGPAASSTQDEGQTSQTSRNTYDNQALTETDWWAENDGLTFGYLHGGYGFGLATCGAGSRSTGRGSAWWSAAGTSVWFLAGQQLPYPYGSGWCGNNAYGNLWGNAPALNQIIVSPGIHRHLVGKRRMRGEINRQALLQAAGSKAPRLTNPKPEGPDDDWTRVEDHFERAPVQRAAALPRERNQGIRPQPNLAGPSRLPQARAAGMRGFPHAHLVKVRTSAPRRISGARGPKPHIAARPGGHGHS